MLIYILEEQEVVTLKRPHRILLGTMDECMLNDLLECSVCLERLDTSSKVLPCQHTFCKKCLDEIVMTHRELRCPECRILVNAKVEELPPNVLLMRILEGMRNAAPKTNKVILKNNSEIPQRLQGGHQAASTNTSTLVTSSMPAAVVSSDQHVNITAKPIHLHNRPYGRAIYDYISKVPGDLNFRKGDVIILRKKIDNNWYFGECGTNHGVFPLSYVQVVTPLPSHIPQCTALYDFRMMNDEEDGCLTFNKGEVISVIRRVDENWAEGKLLDRIGIFPLAFVELNSVARALMKFSTNVQPGPSRVAPPTPTNEETTPLIPTDHTQTVQSTHQSAPVTTEASTLSKSESSPNVSSGDSSTSTSSPVTTSPSSSNSSTTPSSPSSPAVSPPVVVNRNTNKRHSFTGLNSTHQQQQQQAQQHRHSAEILSLDSTPSNIQENSVETSTTVNAIQPTMNNEQNSKHKRSGSNELALNPPAQSSTPSTSTTANLPSAYIALYPYKPQKADELELRKGGIYMVTERCQDGWFKGTSNRTQKCGVFPGNYVVPAKFQRTMSRSVNQANSQSTAPSSQPISDPRMTISYTKNKSTPPQPSNLRPLPPPELPPRSASPSTVGTAAWHNQRHIQNLPNQVNNLNSNKPPSTVISSIFSSGKISLVTSMASSHPSTSVSDSNRSSNNSPLVSSSSSSVSPSTIKPSEKVKEKKEKGVSLMRRLTNIKKSKSPPPTTYSMDNPVFDDGNAGQSSITSPLHIRSGSCPSQLLQLPSNQDLNSNHRLYPGQIRGTTSQRVKHKERPSLPVTFTPRPDEASSVGTPSNHHRKSHSLDANMGKQTKPQLSSRDRVYRFRCIVPYPPNSEFELELRVGDIIYVHKKRDDGWYKGTQQRTGRTGLFPASFVEAF